MDDIKVVIKKGMGVAILRQQLTILNKLKHNRLVELPKFWADYFVHRKFVEYASEDERRGAMIIECEEAELLNPSLSFQPKFPRDPEPTIVNQQLYDSRENAALKERMREAGCGYDPQSLDSENEKDVDEMMKEGECINY